MVVQLLIFDFDGVVVDSEELASRALVGLARDLGVQISQGEALDRFVGKRAADVALAIEQLAGQPLPNFISDLERRTFAIFDSELREVRGLRRFLIKTSSIRRCIASSSSQERIRYTLNLLSLEQEFGRIYSADEVERGKPFPDLFIYAAANEGICVDHVVVIQDSVGGLSGGSCSHESYRAFSRLSCEGRL